MIIYIGVSME